MNRREFIIKSAGYAAFVTFRIAAPDICTGATVEETKPNVKGSAELLKALEASDANAASIEFGKMLHRGGDPWEIHLALFPVVQRVLNPPFINPHLPKMYAIYRELVPYLNKEEIPPLIRLGIMEYARRPKLEEVPQAKIVDSPVSFVDIESAIRGQDREKTAVLMATFYAREGGRELARRLLLLGSGYLDHSLGHSISCTVYILLEMLERSNQDPWPALATLADYFCKGRFHKTPVPELSTASITTEEIDHQVLRATSGGGIINLHHTITFYSLERVRKFFSEDEYHHMIGACIRFMKDKKARRMATEIPEVEPPGDYTRFYQIFSEFDAKDVVASVRSMIPSQQGRQELGRFLIKAVCDQYQGDYNPHYLTGLGSVLWVAEQYWNQADIATNALLQYLDFFFEGIKS